MGVAEGTWLGLRVGTCQPDCGDASMWVAMAFPAWVGVVSGLILARSGRSRNCGTASTERFPRHRQGQRGLMAAYPLAVIADVATDVC